MENLVTSSNLKTSDNRIEFMDLLKDLFRNSNKEKEMNDYHKAFKQHNEDENDKFRNLKTEEPKNELPNQNVVLPNVKNVVLSNQIDYPNLGNLEPKIKEI